MDLDFHWSSKSLISLTRSWIFGSMRRRWAFNLINLVREISSTATGRTMFGLPLPIKWQPIYYYEKIRLMLTMKKVGQTPSLFSAPILMGSFFGLLSLVWRPKFLHGYPLVLGFLFVGIFVPYYFVNNWGYPPRFSIHLLPIAVMSSILVIRNIELTLRNSKFD